MKTEVCPPPRIYVADLAACHAGEPRGVWIELRPETTARQVRQRVTAMLDQNPTPSAEDDGPKYAIHDYENFGGLWLRAHESLEHIIKLVRLMAQHGELAAKIVEHYGGLRNGLARAEKALKEQYAGATESLSDWVRDNLPDGGKGRPWLTHLDMAKHAEDLEFGGELFVLRCDGKLHVFWLHAPSLQAGTR